MRARERNYFGKPNGTATENAWSLLKVGAAAGAVQLVAPFILTARGEAPITIGVDSRGSGRTRPGSEISSGGEGDQMIYRTFGRTGLRVSAAGLGGGGFSRLGL